MNPKARHDVLKAISRTVDVLLRVAAIIAALASLPMALFLAAMANGNSKSATITIIVLLVYLALIIFLIWLAARAKRAWSRGIIYIIGVAGIWGGVDRYHRQTHSPMPELEVSIRDIAYPRNLNPNPLWTIRIAGNIEEAVRFDGFEIHYETVIDRENPVEAQAPCSRHFDNDEKRPVYPLQHTERVKPEVVDRHYALSVVVDKFKPDKCQWMATEIGLVNVDLPKTSRPLVNTVIEGFSPYHGISNTYGPRLEGLLRIDLWCRTYKNQPVTYGCDSFPIYPRPASIKPQLEAIVPSESRSIYTTATAHGDSPAFQINFHNYDALLERAVVQQ
jgi:hypothetical protein